MVALGDVTAVVKEVVPVTDPPKVSTRLIPDVPPSGSVAVMATLTTEKDGILCLAVETVDTGSPP